MQIEDVETFVAHNWLIVRIRTDTGLEGVGESTFFGWPHASEVIVQSFARRLLGQDPLRVEHHWLDLYRSVSMRGMAIGGALSAIDQALWDIRGKHFGAPVWQLLGGRVRDRVRAMLVLPYGTIDEVAGAAAAAVHDGYTAVKVLLFQPEHHAMNYTQRFGDLLARADAVREATGWGVDIGVELHRNTLPGEAVALISALEPMRPFFVEDPVAPDSVIAFSEVAQKCRVPMAAGERNTTIWEFREYVEKAGINHVRPDVGIAGGITHMRKICALAESHHQGVIPHAVPSGPVATAAHVQLGATVPNWEVQEHRSQDGEPWTKAVRSVIAVEDGHLIIPESPGLGIEIDEEGLRSIPPSERRLGAPLRDDGSVALR